MAEERMPKTVNSGKKNPRITAKICEYMTYSGREAFKRLRTNTLIGLGEDKEKTCRVIGVTSAQPSEGKSTVSINLAYSLAELGKSVLLIDGDLRRPSIHYTVGDPMSPGLNDVLTGKTNLKDAMVRYQSSANEVYFDMVLSGGYADNPSELLNSGRFQKFIEVVSNVYQYVIIDLPPVNAVVDAVGVSKLTDGLIVVIRENHCPRYVLNSCMEQLQYAKANILGFAMNGCIEGAGKHYQYSNYNYQYGK